MTDFRCLKKVLNKFFTIPGNRFHIFNVYLVNEKHT